MKRVLIRSWVFLLYFALMLPVSIQSAEYKELANELEVQVLKFKQSNNLSEKAKFEGKLGYLYWENNVTAKALEWFQEAIKTNEAIGNLNAIKVLCTNIGLIYSDENKFEEAIGYFKKSYRINEKFKKRSEMADDLVNISNALQATRKWEESNKALEEALVIFQEEGDIKSIKNCYTSLYENYDKLGHTQKAKEYFELAATLSRKLQSNELKQMESRTKQAEAITAEKEKEIKNVKDTILKLTFEKQLQIELLSKEKELTLMREKAQKEELAKLIEKEKNRKRLILGMSIIMGLILGLFFVIIWQLKERKKSYQLLEESNKQVLAQKQEIENQRDIANLQKKKITDSIKYAQRIQQAVLPPVSMIEKCLPESFVLFKPRDIVSGDFYWITQKEGVIIITVADCTGHGVPGAFMSMLGIAFLNEIVSKLSINKHIRNLNANDILNQLRDNVISSLHQTGKFDESKDGMDIALCIIDMEQKSLQYAGAHNPIYLVRKGQLIHYEADKMPIGIYKNFKNSFKNNEIQIENDDIVYLFSDGYYDQIGGPQGTKYFSANFKKKLLEISTLPMKEQAKILEKNIEEWKNGNEQVDDMLVVGFKLNSYKVVPSTSDENNWSNKRVLIAEDMDINYFLLSEALKPTKTQVFRVLNGAEAVEFCKTQEIDLILMDIRMPIMDGIEATQKIRQFRKDIPIVAQTAQNDPEDKEKIFAVGCNDYISKPIDLKTFLTVLKKYLS